VPSEYRVASPFLIRLAGVPFDVLERLASPKTFVVARESSAASAIVTAASGAVQQFLDDPDNGLSRGEIQGWRDAISRAVLPKRGDRSHPVLAAYVRAVESVQATHSKLQTVLEQELEEVRQVLLREAETILPPYLLFAAAEMRHLFANEPGASIPTRNSWQRKRERHLLLYLQRVAAKNDTFGEFGPSAWGRIGNATESLTFSVQPGIARREAFLERWTAHALAAAMNADPSVFCELKPRLNPNGVLRADTFVLTDTGQVVPLSAAQLEIVRRCNAQTAVHLLGAEQLVRELADLNVIICRVEVPALEAHAVDVLANDVRAWRDGEARGRWGAALETLTALPPQLAQSNSQEQRAAIVNAARDRFSKLGAERASGSRALYAAVNPIAEECFRECKFEISAALADEVATDAAPWFDLWRDTYAFIANRVAGNLRMLLQKAPVHDGALPLPAFLRFCEAAKIPLAGPGMVGMAHLAFQEVKAAFRERLQPHAEANEYELTAEDCHVVRRNLDYPKFDEFTYPSADLQLEAESADAVARGEYRWIVSELHPPVATLHHCMYWSCPDHAALSKALISTVKQKPTFHFGFFAADFTAHTALRNFSALPALSNFVAPQRADPAWRYVPPGETDVFTDESTGDVGLRHAVTREYLGSFARAWLIPLGFHPFQFALSPHTPRLRCGKVIVQRRTWSVGPDALAAGNFAGVSRDLVLAIEKLRASRGLPRFVYIRPTEQALRRAGAVGRDKDTKPVFVDFESYLSLEIFHRWLTKAGELELTEMLPEPDKLLWKESDGRRTFELRTLIVPRT